MGSKKENKSEKVKNKANSNKHADIYKSQTSSITWWTVFGAILICTAATRFYKISEPDHVVWDETHFGKFASWYINNTFFFDVHPPLGKMLIGGVGYLTGYDGAFPFVKPGDKYEDVNYLGMRVLCTSLGAALVPFAFIIVWEMTKSLSAATFSSSLILFDIGLLTLNQYILLDPILLFFIMGSVVGLVKFRSCSISPFSVGWWFWLTFTGFMLSGSISVKFVGAFVVLYVGIHTVKDLWDIYGNLNNSMFNIIKHFVARAIGLIVLPAILYMVYFFIHFSVLTKTGNGDGFYSSAFQSQLEGNSLFNASMPLEVAYGAEISLKNARTGGGYLHSHIHLYPEGEGARQQQITTYSHKDFNNKWVIKKWNEEPGDFDDDGPTELIKNGDLIRLEHVPTGRNLHSHRESAPVTKRHFQVTGYGENGEGDINDVWRIELITGQSEEIIKTVVQKMKFTHYLVGCTLNSHNKQLPKWGFEQMEVTCAPSVSDSGNVWNIEDNLYPKLPNTTFNIYGPSFLEKFIESHTVMLQGNSGLKPKEGEVTSQPWQWPINYRGQWFSAIEGYRVYLLGNPIIWWGNIVVMALFVFVYAINIFRSQRGYKETPKEKSDKEKLLGACGWLIIAWAIHYLPFFFMGRILYFHHYFPALLFSSMLTGIILDYICRVVPNFLPKLLSATLYHILAGSAYSILVYSFYVFSPLAYGMHNITSENENSTVHGLKWLETWEF